MALVEDLKARFPDLDEALIDKYAPIYANVYKAYYGADYGVNPTDNEIILNLIAHLIVTASQITNGESVKQTASESVGSVSVSYALPQINTADDNFFNSTIYGQTFLMLTKRNIKGYFV